jgi:hypothetical protein
MTLLDQLARRELVVVTGKGGVGKSAMSATLGRVLTGRGSRVLLLETDPRENVHQLLDVDPSGGEIVEVEPGLFLQNLRPRLALDQFVMAHLRIEYLVRKVLDSPVYVTFVEGAPGLKEVAVLGHALRAVRGEIAGCPEIDTVVLDAPATGHSIRHGPFSTLAHDLAELVADAERCGIVVVTLAEEMPAQEALELREELERRLDRSPELLIVNGLYPPGDGPGGAGPNAEVVELFRERRRLHERERERLAGQWNGARIELPLLPIDRGVDLVAALGDLAARDLDRETGAP